MAERTQKLETWFERVETKFFVNNNTCHAKENSTILQACETVGVYIPRFCYSDALSIAGNCRMCLVEIEKSPKLMPACAIKISPDIKVYTKTNLVKKTRENILEFLLINHPLDCPICDQGGECDLQDQANTFGSDRGRFYEYKRSMQDKNGGPLIKTIMTRCIHCTRCIRFATEIAGKEVYGTSGRGKGMEVGTYIDATFDSELSGNVIDLCPVGALTSKPYAFTVRPWELKNIESIDIFDGIGSNIRIDIRGTELMRILPKANSYINQQWITDKARFSYDGLQNQRLETPMIKNSSNTFIAISWKQALFALTQKLIKFKPKNICTVIGEFVDQETTLTVKNCMHQLGISKLFLQQHTNSLTSNLNLDFRSNYILNKRLNSLEGPLSPDFILLIGTNTRYEASLLNIRLRQLYIKKDVKIVSIGQPLDLTYKHKHLGNGINTLNDLAQGSHLFTSPLLFSNNPISILGLSPLQRVDGNVCYSMVQSIFTLINDVRAYLKQSLLNGRNLHSISKKGFNYKIQTLDSEKQINVLHAYANTVGAFDLGIQPSITDKIENNLNNMECIYLLGADYVFNKEKNASYVIYQGHHGDIGATYADIILPSSAYVEKVGKYVNTEGRVQQTEMAIQSEQDTRDDWKIIKALTQSFSSHVEFSTFNTPATTTLPSFAPLNMSYLPKPSLELFMAKVLKGQENLWESSSQNDFSVLFDNTAPHVNENHAVNLFNTSIKANHKPISQPNIFYTSSFKPLFDNFYLSNSISRASVLMGKCSSLFSK